jgi:hypothetical protein
MQEKVSKTCGITASKWRMPRISTEIGNKTMVVGFFRLSMKAILSGSVISDNGSKSDIENHQNRTGKVFILAINHISRRWAKLKKGYDNEQNFI